MSGKNTDSTMSDDMAEFIKRKRESEVKGDSVVDEKEKRREEIMKRVAERRKLREEQGVGGAKVSSSNISRLNEELKQKDATHQKEVFELRKTIEDLHKQISELSASNRNAEQKQNEVIELQNNIKKLEEDKINEQNRSKELIKEIEKNNEENENNNQKLKEECDKLKAEKTGSDETIKNLREQVDQLIKIKDSGASSDEKISQLSQEIKDKNNEISLLKKQIELITLEKENLVTVIEEQEQNTTERTALFDNQKASLERDIITLKESNSKLEEENKEIKTLLEETSAINKELQEAVTYQKSVVEDQESKILELVNAIQENKQVNDTNSSLENENKSSNNEKDKNKEEIKNNMSTVRPSDSFEAALIGEINLLRSNPDAYADYLVDIVECYNGLQFNVSGSDHSFDTKEGVNALEDAIEYLQSFSHSCPPLSLVDGLCLSCQYLCDQNGPTGSLDTKCEDGKTSQERLVLYGQWKGRVMELMSYGPRADSPREIVTQWLIDDGNYSRSQRTTLLDFDFKVAGVGHGKHEKMSFMTVLAVAKDYINTGETRDCNDKTILKENANASQFIIKSDPCNVPKENVSLSLDGKTLLLLVEDESKKTSTQEWDLPFGVPPCNIKAVFNELSEVEITIDKMSSAIANGEQSIYSYKFDSTGTGGDRLKLKVTQSPTTIEFATDPCNCAVEVNVKIVDETILCFESIYTEVSKNEEGTTTTKTVTRKEKVNMPFPIQPSRCTFSDTNAGGVLVTVLKPSVENVVTPIQIE